MGVARVLVAATIVLVPALASAAPSFGVRGSYYAESAQPAVGAELVVPMGERLHLAPSADVLVGDGPGRLSAAADLLYDLSCSCSTSTALWAGGGPALVVEDAAGQRHTRIGLSLAGGVGIRAGRLLPHVQIRALVSRRSDVAIAIGLRF